MTALRSTLAMVLAMLMVAAPTSANARWGEPPEEPENLSGPSTDADGTYTVSWNPSAGAGWYELQERIGAGGWSTTYSGSQTNVTFSKAVVASYSYRVRACSNGNGCSGYSSMIAVNVTGGITSPVSEGTAGIVGSMPYGLDVASDGDAVIGIPLRLIPGVGGFGPSLSLEYDSGRGIDRLEQSLPEDTLGYGWRLAGLSEIRRCVVNQSSSASIQLTNSDSLCLDGMPLVLASGTHFSVGATYRTLVESYIKIAVKGSAGALWFEATLPDGTVREYGNGGGARVDFNGGVDYQWSMNKETNAYGVVIDYDHWFDPSKGVNRIASISYTDATVDFEYLQRTDASAVSIGSALQTQAAFLHTIRVKYDGTKVREYRLLNEYVSSRRRLNLIQLCGYNEAGTTATCLEPIDLDWLTPSSTMAGVEILVDGMTDSLGAVHQVQYGTITGSSHPFLFTERPFGYGSPPSNTQVLSGSGALRHVATKLRRDNGLGGFHDTSYAYQHKGIESTRHWGFLGFYAQRITDEESGIATYVQYRLDYPYFGQVARLRQFDSTFPFHSKNLTRIENDYAQQSISHGSNSTVYPYVNASIDFIYEGTTQLGAAQTTNALTFSGGFVSQAVTTEVTGTSVSTGSSTSTWGDIPTYTVGSLLNTTKTTVGFNNRTASGDWLIGFADDIERESWPGAESGDGIVQDATITPHHNSLKPLTVTRFPTDSFLTLTTNMYYDASGRFYSTTVSGDNVSSRTSSITTFVDDRYPYVISNPKGHTTTNSLYDSRFGTVKTQGNPNGRNTSWVRDVLGRVTSRTNADDIVTATSYSDCSSGCPSSVYGIAPSYKLVVTTTKSGTTVAPKRNSYYDNLGRVIRTETESFDGTTYSKQDIKYDMQGRVEKTSLPYLSGSPQSIIPDYDVRNRIESVTRPDGSSTVTDYSVSGSQVIETVTDNIKKPDGSSDGTQVKRNEYNILGELKKTTDGYGTSVNPSTTYTYDANGNRLTAAVSDGVTTNTTTFEYDAAGNQKKIIDPNAGTITTTYTGLGEVRKITDAKSQLSTYSYDVLGRRKSLVNADGTSTWVWDTAANGKGKLASRSNPGFTETHSYNGDSRLSSIVTNITPIGGGSGTNYMTSQTYDTYGRPFTTTFPGGFELTRAYNARGYLSQFKDGATAVQTINDLDAFGRSVDESYANGVNTLRIFDPETGRLTDVDTTKGSTVIQDNEYAWRSNGTLKSRIANPAVGLNTTRKEIYLYDVLNRVTLARTYINDIYTRDTNYYYNEFGGITAKPSTLSGDTTVTGYGYGAGAAGPNAVTTAYINGVGHSLTYDANGAIEKYDNLSSSVDKYLAYNVFNQPTKIVVGSGLNDPAPEAVDEFAYDPDGQRYARKTRWKDGASTYTEEVAYVGRVEIITDNSSGSSQTITKTRLSENVMHVKIVGAGTEEFFEYAHRDHLGSIEAVTDDNGNVLDNLAFEPFGSREKKDWSANISSAELDDLLDVSSGHSRKARGFTAHEHLDRTGFVHMNGRVYDPVLGRFLSPDPIIQFPAFSQSWDPYSYVLNAPTSFTDPSGFECYGECAPGMAILNRHEAGVAALRDYGEYKQNTTVERPEFGNPSGPSIYESSDTGLFESILEFGLNVLIGAADA
ncbi:MAG: RHS repeat-associated core domain-containing protein, partial [Woeseiaceae bacterium]|nr:RHS repeat-associated core domain-containing protein [Woeseiaceae bacterium]